MEHQNISKASESIVNATSDAIRQRRADVQAFVETVKQHWSSKDISEWAVDTFGESVSVMRVAARANEEMAELLRELSSDNSSDPAKAADEAADVVIVLARVFTMLGTTMEKAVARKMGINLARTWRMDGSGHGYRVRTPADVPSMGCPEVPNGGANG